LGLRKFVRTAPQSYIERDFKKPTKNHTVRTVPKYNRKITEIHQVVPLTHKYMTYHFPDLVEIDTGTYIKWRV
jgi:hypothetical protein